MNKLYNKIVFHNNTTPALNEDNLNEISEAIDAIDDRVIDLAGDVIENIQQIIELTENPPYIGENGNWYVWDTETGAYVDSGVDASISVEIADVTMLPVGETPYVTNTGTSTDPIFHLFIPMGNDGDYNNLNNRPKINGTTLSGSGQGNTYALTDISMVAKYMPSTDLVPTGQTYEKGAIVWIKGLYGQYLRRMNEDAAAGSNWVNKSSAVTLNDLINALYTNVESEVITRASLGAHNLNATKYISKSGSGLTWTVNTDGSVSVTGTAGGDIVNGESFVAPFSAQVILTGGIADSAHIFPWDETDNSRPYTDSTKTTRQSGNVNATNSASFYMEKGHLYRMTLRVNTGYQVNGTFKPMIRLASDSDSTYQPYAKTNKQLTDNVTDIETAIAPIEIGTASQAYAKGDYLIMNDKLYKATTAIVSGATLIVGTNIEQTSVAEELENKSSIAPSSLNSTPISSLDDIPLNSGGRVNMPATLSPSGVAANFNYVLFGTSLYKSLLIMSGDRLYCRVCNNGTWAPWHSFNADS